MNQITINIGKMSFTTSRFGISDSFRITGGSQFDYEKYLRLVFIPDEKLDSDKLDKLRICGKHGEFKIIEKETSNVLLEGDGFVGLYDMNKDKTKYSLYLISYEDKLELNAFQGTGE